jgi:hypothetical protein
VEKSVAEIKTAQQGKFVAQFLFSQGWLAGKSE